MTAAIDGYGRAAAAYAKAARGDMASAAKSPAGGAKGSSFAEMLGRVVDQSLDSGQGAEKQALAAVGDTGNTGLTQVVTAVAEAETTLQTVVAVRERMLEAYKDILRMTI